MFFKVPVKNGVLDINYNNLIEARVLSTIEAVVQLQDTEEIRDTWVKITEAEFKSYAPPIPAPVEPIDRQQEAIDAVMSGVADLTEQTSAANDAVMSAQIETATQTIDANDAIMTMLIEIRVKQNDIQLQLDQIKTKVGA